MALTRNAKSAIIADVNTIASRALSAVVAEYRGLNVEQITQLRVAARKANVSLKVVRNNLAKLAFKDTSFECLEPVLVGPIMIAFSLNEIRSAASICRDFMKQNEQFIVKAISIDGTLMSAHDLDMIAELPSREEALSKLLGTIMAPIGQLARVLVEPGTQLARALQAMQEKQAA